MAVNDAASRAVSAYDRAQHARARELERENLRLKAGLKTIMHSGLSYGGAWCVAQAKGALLDLDFDAYPMTGRPDGEAATA